MARAKSLRARFSTLRLGWRLAIVVVGLAVVGAVVLLTLWSRKRASDPPAFAMTAPVPSGPAFGSALHQGLGVRLLPAHDVELLDNGAIFDALEREIRAARSSVHIVMYIWEKGAASDRMVAALMESTQARGVACRIVYDDFGSPAFGKDVLPALAATGCDARAFRPLPGTGDKLARNHRKIVVIDGRVAFTGGFGVRDDWLGDGATGERWRDANVRFTGPAVEEAQLAFAENWLEAGGPLLPPDAFSPVSAQAPPLGRPGTALAAFLASTASPVLTRAERLVQLVIQSAQKRLWIANAYFVPSPAILELIKRKARAGVDVRLLVPGAKSDSKTSFGAQHVEYGSLIEAGARVWEYQPSMMHAKTMVVDDALAVVGTINLDPLSLGKLEEAALVAYDAALAAKLTKSFEADITRSEMVKK